MLASSSSDSFCDDFPLAKLKFLPNDFPAIFLASQSSDSSPTHIVFRVVYGSQVIMMFDAMSMDDENHMEIQGKLQAQLNLGIPELSGSAEVDAMKFYGDGINMESNPTTFEEAKMTYENLSHLCGKQGAPQYVWLYPLCNLQPSAPKLVQEPSSNTALVVHKVVDDINDLMVRSSDALRSIQVKGLHDRLVQFQEWLGNKKSELTSQIAVLLPKEHKGEHCIEDFIKEFRKKFQYDVLSTWLKQKEEEATILHSFINVILSNDKHHVLPAFHDGELVSCYARFASLIYIQLNVDRKDPFLDSLLEAGEITQVSKSPWFGKRQIVKDLKNATDIFRLISHCLKDTHIGLAVTTNSTSGAEVEDGSGAIACIKEYGVDETSGHNGKFINNYRIKSQYGFNNIHGYIQYRL